MEKFFENFLFAYSFQNKLFFNNIVFCKIGAARPGLLYGSPISTLYSTQ